MVQDGARWCKMVQDGARWCKMVQDSAIPCNTMQYHAIPCKTMQYHAKPCHTMQYHVISCNTMQYHAIPRIPCNTMQYHAIPCNTMQYNAIPCNTMQYHASLITADGAYHCPVGSIMAIFYLLISPKPPDLAQDIIKGHLQKYLFKTHIFAAEIFMIVSKKSDMKTVLTLIVFIWKSQFQYCRFMVEQLRMNE